MINRVLPFLSECSQFFPVNPGKQTQRISEYCVLHTPLLRHTREHCLFKVFFKAGAVICFNVCVTYVIEVGAGTVVSSRELDSEEASGTAKYRSLCFLCFHCYKWPEYFFQFSFKFMKSCLRNLKSVTGCNFFLKFLGL